MIVKRCCHNNFSGGDRSTRQPKQKQKYFELGKILNFLKQNDIFIF